MSAPWPSPWPSGDISAARLAVGAIVGRDVTELDEPGVAAAALESLAESFNDGVVAPIFWFVVAGVPGLFVYKAVNTADSLIGHREPRWRDFGWASARMDDLMNLIPARIAGCLIALAGRGGWRVMARDARKHASPNSGWPEAAMAGALKIQLGGSATYDGVIAERADVWRRARPRASDLEHGLKVYVTACGPPVVLARGRRTGMAALMIQGCGSDVGKSVLVAGLCRVFANRGLRVRPFKPQNMSNNAAVTADGGEIGRAQALQAMACRTPLTVDMNPVLLKPQSDVGAQLVVLGKMMGTWKARGYQERKGELLDTVLTSFRKLEAESDLVIVEGAGSPAEINLRAGDIANMGFARAADVPVVLVGDIDRGHVIAALVGAHAVLEEGDRAMVRGFLINKFRGDPSLFQDGRTEITRRTGWVDLGMAPWLAAARSLPAEDAVILDRPTGVNDGAFGSSRRCCRGSPTSTISTPCGSSRRSISPSSRPASRCRVTPIW
jgi:dethiobiotin synthetase